MSKLIGKRKQSYLTFLLRQDRSLDAAAVERLTARLDKSIRSLRVTKADIAAMKAAAAAEIGSAADGAPPAQRATARPFDPYAFNALLTLKRDGRAALEARLGEVTEVGHLRRLAQAQLIGLDQDMRSGDVAIEDLREAIVRGVERLLADRRAATR